MLGERTTHPLQPTIPLLLRRSLWGLALAFLAWILLLAFRHPFKPGKNTFSAFYYAALAIRNQAGAAALPGDYIYPPFLAWAIQPLTRLPIAVAFRVWLGFSFLLTSSSMLVGWSAISRYFGLQLNLKHAITIVLAAFLLSAGEAKTEWSVAQCDGLVLDSFSFSLALLAASPIAAGLVIALGANIKYQTLVLIPYLLWRGHWRAAVSALLGFPLIGAISALSLGWKENLLAWSSAVGGLGKFFGLHTAKTAQIHGLDWTSSISLPSAFARILPSMGVSEKWAYPSAFLIALLLFGLIGSIYYRHRVPLIGPLAHERHSPLVVFEWSSITLFLLAFGPQTTRRHLFILMLTHLLVMVLLFSDLLTRTQRQLLFWTLVFYQLGLRLPPSGGWFNPAADAWKWLGGPSWCILPLLFVLLKTGVEQVSRPPRPR